MAEAVTFSVGVSGSPGFLWPSSLMVCSAARAIPMREDQLVACGGGARQTNPVSHKGNAMRVTVSRLCSPDAARRR
jgi:hypothetical protein